MGLLSLRRRPTDAFIPYKPPPPFDDASLRKTISDEIDELIKQHAPKTHQGITLGSVPFVTVVKNPNTLVDDIVYKLSASLIPGTKTPLFAELSPIVRRNVALASEGEKEKYVPPKYSKLPPVPLVRAYLKDTPFRDVLLAPTPYKLSDAKRVEHTYILARTGHGKSNLLTHMICQDLIRSDAPAIIVIEPKNDLVHDISWLQIFADNPDRLAIIDPNDHPAFNLFALPDRLKNYPTKARASLIAGIINQYTDALAALDADASSAQQKNTLAATIEVVFNQRGNLTTFISVLEDPARELEKSQVQYMMDGLEPEDVDFFRNQYFSGTIPSSRKSLANKLRYLKKIVPQFSAMFGASANKIDLYERMQTPGSITFINTSEGSLKQEASSFFGRLMLSQILSAALERQQNRAVTHPVFVIIDEAHLYVDPSINKFLNQTRSAKVSLTFANQKLADLGPLQSALLSQPAIYLANANPHDAPYVAAAMRRTKPTAFDELEKGDFIAYVNGDFSSAQVHIPYRQIDTLPKMSKSDHLAFLDANKARFADEIKPQAKTHEAPRDTPKQEKRNPHPSGIIDIGDG